MSETAFLILFLAGAAGLALWVDARYPDLMPGSRGVVLHVLAAFVVLQIGSRLVAPAIADSGISGGQVLAVVLIVLPLLSYAVLAGLWVLRLMRDPLRTG